MYIVKTGRLVGQLCDDGRPIENIFYIWKRTDKDNLEENDLVFCLTSSCTLSFNPTTGKVVSQVSHPDFLQLPQLDDTVVKVQVTFKSAELSYQPDRIYFLAKQDANSARTTVDKSKEKTKKLKKKQCFLTGYTTHKKKLYRFGQVNQAINNVLFAANSNLVVKVAHAIVGKKGAKLSFFTPEGLCLDGHAIPKDRPITCISMHPTELAVASGDKSGKICVWRNSHDDPNRFFATQMHWHSLPICSLSWIKDIVSDSRYLFSGGGEGAILKWDTRSARRVCIVPRIGATITHISANSGTVVSINSNNSIKIFSPTLEDIASIVGLAQRKCDVNANKKQSRVSDSDINFEKFFQVSNGTVSTYQDKYLKVKLKTKLFFHAGIQAVVLLNGSKNQIQLFDPILKTEKLALDVNSFNKVLGDRPKEEDVPEDDVVKSSEIILFSLSKCGTWLVTVESNWDTLGGQRLKIWHFSSPSTSMGEGKFELNTQINEDISCQISSAEFLTLPCIWLNKTTLSNGINSLITCGTDKKAKLWRLSNDHQVSSMKISNSCKWEAVRMFTYLDFSPSCSAGSPDQSVFAVGFGPRLTMWDSETYSLLTCLSVKGDDSEYTSVIFGDGNSLSHLVLGTTNRHVLVWNLLTSNLVRKMALDSPTLFPLNSNSIAVLHSRGAIALNHALDVSLITSLESINGIASDNRTNSIYLLHSTAKCDNMLTCVKQKNSLSNEKLTSEDQKSFRGEAFEDLLKQSVQKLSNNDNAVLRQTRANSTLLSYDLVTPVVSKCSPTFVKLSMPL